MKPNDARRWGDDLAPPDFFDPVIEAYKKDVDRTLLIENLRLSPDDRLRKAISFHHSIDRWRGAARRGRQQAGAMT
jgi:hypothetical protein